MTGARRRRPSAGCWTCGADLAEREVRRRLSRHPRDAQGHALLARALALRGRHGGAMQAAEAAVRLAPDVEYPLVTLAGVQIQAGRRREAEMLMVIPSSPSWRSPPHP